MSRTVRQICGGDIRSPGVRCRLFLRLGDVGSRTDADWWIAGFRAFSLFVFFNRYSWGQARISVEFRGRILWVKAFPWRKS